MNPNMFANVVLASKPTNGAPPIITIHARYPRIIHGEVMTHRVFSRNARSSRAVPVKTMLNEVRNDPFVPWHWGKNQKGMQASQECNEPLWMPTVTPTSMIPAVPGIFASVAMDREAAWLVARDRMVEAAEAYMEAGYHKQVANRLLEPFSWIDTLITSTSWANFFHLRDHEDAEPHFHDLAGLVREAIDGAEFQELAPGDWHLPYVTEVEQEMHYEETLQKLSVARCARISYAPFDGDASITRELERYAMLVGSEPLHASPTEHQATPDTESERFSAEGELVGTAFDEPHLAGNLGPGWVQLRKTLPGEFVAG